MNKRTELSLFIKRLVESNMLSHDDANGLINAVQSVKKRDLDGIETIILEEASNTADLNLDVMKVVNIIMREFKDEEAVKDFFRDTFTDFAIFEFVGYDIFNIKISDKELRSMLNSDPSEISNNFDMVSHVVIRIKLGEEEFSFCYNDKMVDVIYTINDSPVSYMHLKGLLKKGRDKRTIVYNVVKAIVDTD